MEVTGGPPPAGKYMTVTLTRTVPNNQKNASPDRLPGKDFSPCFL